MAHPASSGSGRSAAREPRGVEEEQAAAVMPQPGMSFRGGLGGTARDAYEVGRTYRHDGILRSSRDVRVATDNFDGEDIVVLLSNSARDVSATSDYPEEAETVFWPDPSVTVVAQRQISDRIDATLGDSIGDRTADRTAGQRHDPRLADSPFVTVVVVRTDGSDADVDVEDAVQRAGRAIAAARETPELPIPRPGRFRGPIGEPARD